MKYSKELHERVRQNLRMFDYPRFDDGDIDCLLDEIERLQAERRWIPASEKLPEYGVRVLFFGGGEMTTHIGYYVPELPQWTAEDGGYYHGKNIALITHWTPLPPPPEAE